MIVQADPREANRLAEREMARMRDRDAMCAAHPLRHTLDDGYPTGRPPVVSSPFAPTAAAGGAGGGGAGPGGPGGGAGSGWFGEGTGDGGDNGAGGGGDPPAEPAAFGGKAILYPNAANGDYHSNGNITDPPQVSIPAFACWYAPIDVTDPIRKVIVNQHSEAANGWWFERIGGVSKGNLRFFFNSGAAGLLALSTELLDEVDSTTPIWQFVGFRFTSGAIYFYHGFYDATGASSLTTESNIITATPIVYSAAAHFRLGGTAGGTFPSARGDMCEAGYYSVSSDADMALLYNGGVGLGYGDFSTLAVQPTAHYVMDDVSGTLVDSTGNHNLARVDAAGTDVVYERPGPNP